MIASNYYCEPGIGLELYIYQLGFTENLDSWRFYPCFADKEMKPRDISLSFRGALAGNSRMSDSWWLKQVGVHLAHAPRCQGEAV